MTSKRLLAMLCALAMLATACGGSSSDEADSGTDSGTTGDTSADDSGTGDDTGAGDDSDTGDDTGTDGGGEASAAALDIDAVLAADLDNCAEAPTGEPIKVGLAMDFSEVSGFADIPGSESAVFLAELINCSGGCQRLTDRDPGPGHPG